MHEVLAALTCSVTMVWAPNTAIGSPWRSHDRSTTQCDLSWPATRAHVRTAAVLMWLCIPRRYGALPGTAEFRALDTNHDGHVTAKDDPWEPYYPGACPGRPGSGL